MISLRGSFPCFRLAAMSLGVCVVSLAVLAEADAQDTIVLQKPEALARIRVSGTIEDYTGREITILSLTGTAVNRYPAADVVEVKTQYHAAHQQGLNLVAANQIEPAVRQFEAALKQEDRAWVRREILALLVQCAVRQGDYITAATRFSKLFESDRTTPQFKLIPLKWAPGEITAETKREAQVWLAKDSEVLQLVATSLLLDDAAFSKAARITLQELSASTDSRIKSLAQAQGWRVQIAGGALANLQLEHWQDRVEALPDDLRAGPSYLLGRAYQARREHELAAAAFLWLPLVDDHDYNLAARACLEAGESLSAIGQQAEAESLYAEVARRYSDSPFAAEALGLLKRGTRKSGLPPKESVPTSK